MNSLERTLSIVKPDAVERNLTESIKKIFTENQLKIIQEKKIQISKEEAAEFYKVHQTKPFFMNSSLISSLRFLSTASGFIIERVCSKLLIIIFHKFI